VTALDQALTVTTQVGANRDTAPYEDGYDIWASDGGRPALSGPRPDGRPSLTPNQQSLNSGSRAARTVRFTEKLIISPCTVNAHLWHIFEKLGVNSRVALTRMAEHRFTHEGDSNVQYPSPRIAGTFE
jgi:DNA-binding CsgD family transcriptional regulator